MSAIIITVVLLGITSLVLFFTGWLGVGINILIRLAYHRHQQIRHGQRPQRIFLIRHGESQANVDTSSGTILVILNQYEFHCFVP